MGGTCFVAGGLDGITYVPIATIARSTNTVTFWCRVVGHLYHTRYYQNHWTWLTYIEATNGVDWHLNVHNATLSDPILHVEESLVVNGAAIADIHSPSFASFGVAGGLVYLAEGATLPNGWGFV
jgi:hypothetical protein